MSVRVMTLVWDHGPDQPGDRFVLLAIADNADDHGYAWPSMERIAHKCCMGRRGAQYAVRRLEKAGWITVTAGGGTRNPNHYQINMNRLKENGETSAQFSMLNSAIGDTNSALSDTQRAHPSAQEPSVEPSQLQPPHFAHAASDFDAWWAAYPKKKGKGAARKAYARVTSSPTGTTPAVLLTALQRQRPRLVNDKARGFCPDPATWLNGERWDDEVEPISRNDRAQQQRNEGWR